MGFDWFNKGWLKYFTLGFKFLLHNANNVVFLWFKHYLNLIPSIYVEYSVRCCLNKSQQDTPEFTTECSDGSYDFTGLGWENVNNMSVCITVTSN